MDAVEGGRWVSGGLNIYIYSQLISLNKKIDQEKKAKKELTYFWKFELFFNFLAVLFVQWVRSWNKKDKTWEKEKKCWLTFFEILTFKVILKFFLFICSCLVFWLYGLFNRLGSWYQRNKSIARLGWGIQEKPWLTTPINQFCLGHTLETLADPPNEPDAAGVYNRNPGWPPRQTRVGWGIH